MNTAFHSISLFILLGNLCAQEPATPSGTLPLRDRLSIIQTDKRSEFGAGSLKSLESQEGRDLSVEEREVFETTDNGKWRTFEDEIIKFEVPDHKLFTVKVLDQKSREPIRVVGGVASMADNSFQRAYHLKVGELYYGVIFVREADWFDEGICLCGPIVFKKCVLQEGTALEFSLLPSGAVKKVQALGAKHRGIVFEWTHSVIPQSAYARLGASVRFKDTSTRSLAQWQAFSKEKRGPEGLASWLEPGDTRESVLNLFGKPTRTTGDIVEYVSEKWRPDGDGFRTTVSIDLKGNRFSSLGADWNEWKELPPKPGSISWAEKRVEHWSTVKSEGTLTTENADELKQIANLFVAAAPDPQADWSRWSRVASAVVQLGEKDARILTAVLARYRDEDEDHSSSNEILNELKYSKRQELFEARTATLLKRDDPDEGGVGFELNNLFATMDRKSPAYPKLIQTACAHKSPHTRGTGYTFATQLAKAVGLDLLKKGLDDADETVRETAARNIDEVVGRADLQWLRERSANEKSEGVKKWLEAAIKAAGKAKR